MSICYWYPKSISGQSQPKQKPNNSSESKFQAPSFHTPSARPADSGDRCTLQYTSRLWNSHSWRDVVPIVVDIGLCTEITPSFYGSKTHYIYEYFWKLLAGHIPGMGRAKTAMARLANATMMPWKRILLIGAIADDVLI